MDDSAPGADEMPTIDDLAADPAPHGRFSEGLATRREKVVAAAGLATSALVAVLALLPSPYAIGGPGPTYDTLGTGSDGTPLVSISGAPTYEPSGELRLVTVSVQDAGSRLMTMGSVLRGYLSSSAYTTPREAVFGTDQEADAVEQQSHQEWVTSQEAATVSALEALGTEVSATLTVAVVLDSSAASGVLQVGDVLTAVDGEHLDGFRDLSDAIAAHAVGDELTVTIDRDGITRDVQFALVADADGNPIMGILVDPTFDLPIDVNVAIDTVGGPSAGLMFTLGIMDKLTEKDELNGAAVAGTGTIDSLGNVGAIGGIDLKMIGARRDGADWFLAPVANCSEVVGHVPDGLSVVAVKDIGEAYAAIEAIGAGQTEDLPTCEAVAG
ncbi:YlbL family protein [Demequina capsici]|uniref:endopeptidase La n=1 Tax=Demequina capsici TaxID=3075620 RepID=A0AA96J9V5_9MICO|nr:PDZ domain-containing protein [Demequina sp. OYTSA14]WNM23911.1 PDZ domain-containing protein [Demequina sp. OYTSA14]